MQRVVKVRPVVTRSDPEAETLVWNQNKDMPVVSSEVDHRGRSLMELPGDHTDLTEACFRLIRVGNVAVLNDAPAPLIERLRLIRDRHGPHPSNPSFIQLLAVRSVFVDTHFERTNCVTNFFSFFKQSGQPAIPDLVTPNGSIHSS